MPFNDVLSEIDAQGFAIVPGFDVAEPAVARAELLNFFQSPAEPISYFNQPLVMDVKPQPGYDPASSGGDGYFDLHTDLTFAKSPPKIFGLLCIGSDLEGGDSLIVDGRALLSNLVDANEALRSTDVSFSAPPHVMGDPMIGRVVSGSTEKPNIRFRADLVSTTNGETPELIAKLLKTAHSIMQIMHLAPGDLLLVDNHRMLHGRTKITANPSQRHLLRIYSNVSVDYF